LAIKICNNLMNDDFKMNAVVLETFEKVNSSGSIPRPRSAATLAAVGSKLYLFGGLSNNVGWLNDFHVFDTGEYYFI